MKNILLIMAFSLFYNNLSFSHDIERDNIKIFIENMVEKHGFDEKELSSILAQAESKESILNAISRPAERTLTWNQYRDIFIKDERIVAGVKFWKEHTEILNLISEETGVSIEILVGIIGVETYYGRITGGYRVIDALSTLAFDYPKRSPFLQES